MIANEKELTPAVLAVMQQTTDPRLREIMVSLVTHLHGFVRDVRLTEAEFRSATALLARLGQQTNATHNEVVLMAGSLGVSHLVCLLNNGQGGEVETSQNLLGPFWRMNSPATPNGGCLVRSDTPGPVLFMCGEVVDQQGQPVAGAEVDVWHCAPTGYYENQDIARAQGQTDMNLRGKFTTDARGRFWLRSVKPVGYPVPVNGVVGELLSAQGRHPMRPAHVHALIVKPGFKTVISQVYDAADPNLLTDVQFGVTQALSADFVRHDEAHPEHSDVAAPWYSLDFRFVMEPGESRLPAAPIK